jgi:hypothetical protein
MSKSNCTKVHPGPCSVPKCGIGKFDPSNRYVHFFRPIPHLGTLHGPGWIFVQLDFDINVYKCKSCKLETSIKKRARDQIISMHININQ